MTIDNRTFPDISFVDTDTERLYNHILMAYEKFMGRTAHPADPVRLFINWLTDIIMQERVIINMTGKQNVPRFAEGDYLDSLAELFKGIKRLQATPARTTMRLHISAPQLSSQIISNGTRITADRDTVFATTESATILPGALFADVPAVCISTMPNPNDPRGAPIPIGARANGLLPGQISHIVDQYRFYSKVENITTSSGGADIESDEAFRERMRNSMESFSTAGSEGTYIYWVKTASQKIVDVMPTSPKPGVIDIRILLEDGEYPNDEIIQLVHDTLRGRTATTNFIGVIPMDDYVKVAAPETRDFDIDLTYFIPTMREDRTETVINNIEQAIERYIKWQTGRMGRDINPDKLIELLRTAGAKRAEINSPVFTVVNEGEVARFKNSNIVFGGLEDE